MRSFVLVVLFLNLLFSLGFGIPSNIDTLYYTRFETDADTASWRHIDETYESAIPVYWHTSDFMAYGGTGRSWWCGDSIEYNGVTYVGYDNEWLQFLTTPSIVLPASPNGNIILTFKSRYKIEPATGGYPAGYDGWDGLNVRISVDGGETFTEIVPIGGYPYSSMYGFGYNGEGPGHPGWGGESAGWTSPQFNLNEYAGEEIMLRFVFASDPGFCTIFRSEEEGNDPTMFGWIIDNILVRDNVDTFFFDDAGDTRPASLIGSNGHRPRGDNWILSTESYRSPSHSWNCAGDSMLLASLISPLIRIPGGDTLTFFGFWYRPDLQDADGDGDNYLDDFFSVWVSDDTGRTWTRLLYDYQRDISMANRWYLIMGDSIYDSSLMPVAEIMRIPGRFTSSTELTSYANKEIMLKWLVRCDDNDDGGVGSGFWLDDVFIYYTVAKHNDVGVKQIGVSPVNINQNVMFTVVLANYGIDNQADVQSLFRIYNSAGSVVHSGGLTPWPSINAGQTITRTITWRPTVPDTYTFRCWTGLITDEDRSNDTLAVVFVVYQANVFELGFDDGVTDTMLDETGTVSWRYLGASETMGDGVGVKFVAPGFDSLTIWKIRAYLGSSAPFNIQLYSATPLGEPGAAIGSPITISEPLATERFTEYLVNRPIGANATFFVFLLNTVDNQMVTLGMDRTSPHDGNSWAYVQSLGGFVSLSDFPRYADVDLMLRVLVYRGTGISLNEDGKVKPKFELHANYPNPFNLGTAISFSIPSEALSKLEIYNALGQRVRVLFDEKKQPGYYSIRFDGLDDKGKALPSGLYFYRLTSGENEAIRSMMIIK